MVGNKYSLLVKSLGLIYFRNWEKTALRSSQTVVCNQVVFGPTQAFAFEAFVEAFAVVSVFVAFVASVASAASVAFVAFAVAAFVASANWDFVAFVEASV